MTRHRNGRGGRRTGAAVVAAAGVLLFAGCAVSGPEPLPGVAGEPTDPGPELRVRGYEEPSELGAAVRVFLGDEGLTVVTQGSSSCPNVPELEAVDAARQVITLSITGLGLDGACTADSSARTFELDVAGDLSSYVVEVTHN